MQKACSTLRDYRKRNWETYISIAGGRKTMSTLMLLAVQFYGATKAFHVLVEDLELEEQGRMSNLRHRAEQEQRKILHPDLSLVKIVQLPFIGLFPWMSDILTALRGQTVQSKDIKEVLESANLIYEGKVTDDGKVVLSILESVESLPEPCPHEPKIQLDKSEPRFKKQIEETARKLCHRFAFICEVEDIGWRSGIPKVSIRENNLEIYFRNPKGFNLGLRIKTTAGSEGQLNRAKSELEKFLKEI